MGGERRSRLAGRVLHAATRILPLELHEVVRAARTNDLAQADDRCISNCVENAAGRALARKTAVGSQRTTRRAPLNLSVLKEATLRDFLQGAASAGQLA